MAKTDFCEEVRGISRQIVRVCLFLKAVSEVVEDNPVLNLPIGFQRNFAPLRTTDFYGLVIAHMSGFMLQCDLDPDDITRDIIREESLLENLGK